MRVVVSQLGAPDDGTDPEAPDNVEFYVGLLTLLVLPAIYAVLTVRPSAGEGATPAAD